MSEQAIVDSAGGQRARSRSLGANIFLQAARTAEFRVGAAIFVGVILLSVIAPTLLGLSATKFNVGLKFTPPFPVEGWAWPHFFGTDQLGRDLLVRSLIGLRNALMIGIASVIGMFVIGSAIGMVAGYVGGWTNLILMRVTDAQMSIPVIILAITILGVTRPTPLTVILVFILAGWPGYARIARSATMSERRKEYVRAAKILGASDLRVLLVHIAPNILPPIAFVAVLDVARMMIFEAILGFIGIGIQPPTPTFGTIIADGTKYLLNAWWITTIPGLLLAVSLCSINLMGGA
ncbi:ABC transporter permease, partial [Mesorhizobium sp. M2C.T.Ca.TU.009.01.2.1]